MKNDHRSKKKKLLRWSFFTLIYNCSSKWIISYTSHHFTPHRRYEVNKLTSLPMCGFIAQLVEQRTGNAEVTGSNPVEALIFFRFLLSNCLNQKIYCDDHSSLSSTNAVLNELFHILHISIMTHRTYLMQLWHELLEENFANILHGSTWAGL